MSVTIAAYEAKTHFSELLERATNGETITVSRHGTPVAQLGPITGPQPDEAKDAVATIRQLRSPLTLGGLSINDLKNEGRK
ncbi:MAG: type II toxin-antitoxin system prevent-host-death family antitoxin [Propionibacteriaceae bacterium]|jgi:prevent-host-death family protein|nr:type II toxin-antitoxin system prevent-host-death family antitoxin [Propionibacteriaceae bacterium]